MKPYGRKGKSYRRCDQWDCWEDTCRHGERKNLKTRKRRARAEGKEETTSYKTFIKSLKILEKYLRSKK